MSEQVEARKDTTLSDPAWGMVYQLGEDKLYVHDKKVCAGPCVFHSPSDHHMRDWPMNIRFDKFALVERTCRHGVGHPDPDSIAYFKSKGEDWVGVHGCDGCCRDSEAAEQVYQDNYGGEGE